MATPSSIYKDPASNRLFYKDASGAMQPISDPTQLATLAKQGAILPYQAAGTYKPYTPPAPQAQPQPQGQAQAPGSSVAPAPVPDSQPLAVPQLPTQGSPMAFSQAVGQLMQKAQYNQGLQDSMKALLQAKYDNALSIDTSKMPLAVQQAIQSRDQAMLDFQITALRSQIQGRATDETKALQYLVSGFQDEQAQITARAKEANDNIQKMLTTYGSTLSEVGVTQDELNQFQQTGVMPASLATKLMKAATLNQQKIEASTEKARQDGLLKLAALQQKGTTAGQNITVNIPGLGGGQPIQLGGTRKAVSVGGGAQTLSPDSIDMMAQTYLTTGNLPSVGMGTAGAQQRAAIINRAAQMAKEQGMTGQDVALTKASYDANKAALSALTKQKTASATYEKTVEANLKLLTGLSNKVDRTGSPVVNRYLLKLKGQYAGDKDVAAFQNAITVTATEYAKVMTGSLGSAAVTDAARGDAEEMLNSAMTKGQLDSVIALMRKEMANRMNSFDSEQSALQDALKQTKSDMDGEKPNSNDPLGLGI